MTSGTKKCNKKGYNSNILKRMARACYLNCSGWERLP